MEIISVVVTLGAGFLSALFLGTYMNWPEGGSVVAIAVMGAFILRKLNMKEK